MTYKRTFRGGTLKRQFLPIVRAGLLQGEMANLAGVTRATVNNWMTGRGGIHDLLKPRIAKILEALELAVAGGELPLADTVFKERRVPELRKIVAKYLAKTVS